MTARTRKRIVREATGETVLRVEKVGPTYAKGLQHLAGLGISVRQGEPFARMRLDFELNCGTAAMRSEGRDFGISLRTCLVSLDRENCDVELRSRYEHRLVEGSIEVSGTETLSSERLQDVGVDVGAGASASSATPALFGRLAAGLKFGRKRKEQRQETARRKPRVDLVATFGHDRWRVGDPKHGDARRGDGKLVGTYFVEEKDDDGEPKPLCVLGRADPEAPVSVVVSVSAPIGQVLIERADEPVTSGERREAEALLRSRSTKAQREHTASQADLRARVAGLVLGKAVAEAQREAGLVVPDGEFLIARQTLCLPAPVVLPQEGEEER